MSSIEALLERFIDARERDGKAPDISAWCPDDDRRAALEAAIRRYREVEAALAAEPNPSDAREATTGRESSSSQTIEVDGFRTLERIGAGGMGSVWKLRDLNLDRVVAAKILSSTPATATYGNFLREARALALFEDPRIVRIHDFKQDGPEPVLIMEHIEGFTLDRIGPSLDLRQRVRLLREVADAIHRAHELGIQHRDLKPSNILVDANLEPKIVDFGLAGSDPKVGHGVGTLDYLAPEQLDPSRPIDRRSDVYALGVIFYELLCGELPNDPERPRLPAEIDPEVPEALQAIALQAMDQDPEHRYPTARALAADLGRFLDGRRVLARPRIYARALSERLAPHLEDIEHWRESKLVHDHEARRIEHAYRRLERRDEDWIVESRRLSTEQVALYLGAFLTLAGAVFAFTAQRLFEGTTGVGLALATLALPCAGLFGAARWLEARAQKAVAVAFDLTAVLLLPIALAILLPEILPFQVPDDALLAEAGVANRHLQIATLAAAALAFLLARRTRTLGLSTAFAALTGAATVAVLGDFGLRRFLDDGRYDLVALSLVPLVVFNTLFGRSAERRDQAWLAKPLFVAAALLTVVVLELLALDGRALSYLGISLAGWAPAKIDDPTLLATVVAMTLNGVLIYWLGTNLDRRRTTSREPAAMLLLTLSPFVLLEPLAYLSLDGSYPPAFSWLYLALALAVAWASHLQQRKSFFFAGVLNTALALFLIADRYEWLDVPTWAVALIVTGLIGLVIGGLLDWRARTQRA